MTDRQGQTRKGPTVLPDSMAGGPHGLGDPDDQTLRVMEKDIVVRKRAVEKAKDKCRVFMDAYADCEQREQLKVYFKCKKEAKDMEVCLNKWVNDAKFMDECAEDYLKERSEYRRTGKSKKQRDMEVMVEHYRQKKAAEKLAEQNQAT